MRKRLCLLFALMIVVVGSVGYVDTAEAKGKMKIYSCERISKKYVKVYFKQVKGVKEYKVEYYWEKSGPLDISKAYYKIVKSNKVKKDNKGRSYIKIPGKATIQYVSVSYRVKSKGKWKKWSGYQKVKCNHKWSKAESSIDSDGNIQESKTCGKCGYKEVTERKYK